MGRAPGTLAKWVLSSNNSSVDAVSAACTVIVVAALTGSIAIALSLGLFAEWLSSALTGGFLLALMSAGALFRQTLIEPCRTIERKARAAARQDAAKAAVDSPAPSVRRGSPDPDDGPTAGLQEPRFSDGADAQPRPDDHS